VRAVALDRASSRLYLLIMPSLDIAALAAQRGLAPLLDQLRRDHGGYTLLEHWQQGEFHHDHVIRVADQVLVVATNCNAGVKEVLVFEQVPDRWALWHHRCPDNVEFEGVLPPLLGSARTEHWFDPNLLLAENARSELLPGARRRARGGGWEAI